MKDFSKNNFLEAVDNNDLIEIRRYLTDIWNLDILDHKDQKIEHPEKAIMMMQGILASINNNDDQLFIMLSNSLLSSEIDLYYSLMETISFKAEARHVGLLIGNKIIDVNDEEKIYFLLQRAIGNRNPNIVKAVFEYDAYDINSEREDGTKLLELAFNSDEVLETLLQLGASPNLPNKAGLSMVEVLDKHLEEQIYYISKSTERLIRTYSAIEIAKEKEIVRQEELQAEYDLEFKQFEIKKRNIKSRKIPKIRKP